MDKSFIINELSETVLWLLEITGILLLAVVGIIYHHEWAIHVGGALCIVYFTASAILRRKERRKALTNALVATILATALIIKYIIL